MKHTGFWIALVALVILHHDWWFWNDDRLIMGFMPIGLAYHVFISIAAAALWAWAAFIGFEDYLSDEEPPEIATTHEGT